MNISISEHALEMMAKRGISESEVRDFFDGKIKVLTSRQSDVDPDCIELVYQRLDKQIKIIYSTITNSVVTAYPLRGKK